MNILIVDFFPLALSIVATLYTFAQAWRWADSGKHRWVVYAWFACFGICTTAVALVQVEALQLHDTMNEQASTLDCATDWECEQLEFAQSESEE